MALAEELLALLTVLVTSLGDKIVSSTEMAVSLSPNRIKPSSRTMKLTEMTSLVTASSPHSIISPKHLKWNVSFESVFPAATRFIDAATTP